MHGVKWEDYIMDGKRVVRAVTADYNYYIENTRKDEFCAYRVGKKPYTDWDHWEKKMVTRLYEDCLTTENVGVYTTEEEARKGIMQKIGKPKKTKK